MRRNLCGSQLIRNFVPGEKCLSLLFLRQGRAMLPRWPQCPEFKWYFSVRFPVPGTAGVQPHAWIVLLFSFGLKKIILIVCMYVCMYCVYVCVHTYATWHMWKSEDNLLESVFSFYHVFIPGIPNNSRDNMSLVPRKISANLAWKKLSSNSSCLS